MFVRTVLCLGLLVSALAHTLPAVAAPSLARVGPNLAERLDRGQPVDVLIVMDDALERRQLQSGVGPLQLHSRLNRADHARVVDTRRRLLGALKADVIAAASEPDLELLSDYDQLPIVHARVRSARALENLRRQGRIRSIDPVVAVRTTLAESLALINQPAVAAAGHVGTGTTVAVLDTGVDYKRAAFGSCNAPGGNCKVAVAQDFAAPDGALDTGNFHGTNVAGIVLGVAPGARIAALDVFESNGQAFSNVIINAINWCITNRAAYNIVAINMSLGGGRHYSALAPTDSWGTAIANAISNGIVVVAASGNDGYTNSIAAPAAYSNVVSVGAFYDAGGAVNQVTSFSNSASFLTMVAPGSMITAAGIAMQGTSQAAPHVAGAAAVLRATYPNDTVAQLINKLKLGANLTDSRNGIAKPRLDMQASLAIPPSTYRVTVTKAGSGTGTVTSSAGGLNCGGTCAADITTGNSVTLTALHGPSSMFTGWSGACSGSQITCTLSMTAARSVTANFSSTTAEDLLPGGTVPSGWVQPGGSDAAWASTSASFYVGTHSLKAGAVSHGQTSEVSISGKFRAGRVSFARRVSSEQGQDFLRFYIDDQLQFSWSGEVPWGMVSFPIDSGTRTLRWVYEKSASGSAGSDTAWIDSVNLPLEATHRRQSHVDFNGDGFADVLWRHDVSGANYLWLMNGGARLSGTGGLPSVADLNWQIVTSGDFDGDGRADLLFRHGVDGRNSIWFMDGTQRTRVADTNAVTDRNWRVVGSGDFNNDGKADLLWRNVATGSNAIWFMDGEVRLPATGSIAAVTDLNWQVAGVGDFNGDGKSDIVWRHAVSGSNAIWFMDGLTRMTGTGDTSAVSDVNWRIVGTGDFNADGKADLLWRHRVSGQNSVWLMNGLTRVSATTIPAVADGGWRVEGVADYDDDGRADILWRHNVSGKNSLWRMNGATRLETITLADLPEVRWRVVAPQAPEY